MGPAIAGLDAFRVFTEWLANRARADARRSALIVTPATMPTHILVWLNANQKVTGPIKRRGEVYELYSSDGRSSGYLLRWEGEPSGETVNVLPTALLYSFTAKFNLDPPAPTSRPVPLHVDILSALRLANGSVDLFNVYDATGKRQGHSLSSCHLCPSLTSMANSTGVPLSQACTMAQLSLAALEDEAQPLPVIDQLSAVIWALAVIDSKAQDGAEAMLREQECKVASAAESLLDHKPAMSLNEASKILKPLVDAAASNPPVASVDAMLKRYGSALARLKLVESKTTRKTSFCEAMEQEEQRLEDMSEQDEEKYAAEFADFAAAVIAKRGKPAAPLRLNALHSPTTFFSEATRTKDLCRLGYRVHAQGFNKCDIKNVIKCGFVEWCGGIDKIGEPANLDEEEAPARADDWKRAVFSWIKHACLYGDRDANSRAMLDFSNTAPHFEGKPQTHPLQGSTTPRAPLLCASDLTSIHPPTHQLS